MSNCNSFLQFFRALDCLFHPFLVKSLKGRHDKTQTAFFTFRRSCKCTLFVFPFSKKSCLLLIIIPAYFNNAGVRFMESDGILSRPRRVAVS